MTNASTITDPSTCRREAPIVRSVANSRMRWAIVIESELAITNAPTKSAMPPNASRKSCRNEMNAVASCASFARLRGAVRTCVPGGRIGRICFDELLRADAVDRASPGSGRACRPCRTAAAPSAGRSPRASRRRGSRRRRSGRGPRSGTARTGPSAWTPIGWPTFRSFFDGGRLVDHDLVRRCGHEPCTSVSEFSAGRVGSTLKPEVRRAAEDDRLAVLADQLRLAGDAADRVLHVRTAAEPRARSDWSNGGGGRAVVAREVERALAGDGRVGAAVDRA